MTRHLFRHLNKKSRVTSAWFLCPTPNSYAISYYHCLPYVAITEYQRPKTGLFVKNGGLLTHGPGSWENQEHDASIYSIAPKGACAASTLVESRKEKEDNSQKKALIHPQGLCPHDPNILLGFTSQHYCNGKFQY